MEGYRQLLWRTVILHTASLCRSIANRTDESRIAAGKETNAAGRRAFLKLEKALRVLVMQK